MVMFLERDDSMAEKKKKKNTSKITDNKVAKEGIEEIFATSPNKDKDDFVKPKPKKKKTKEKKEIEAPVKKEKVEKKMEKETSKKTVSNPPEVKFQEPVIEETEKKLETKELIVMAIIILLVVVSGIFYSTLNRIQQKLDILDNKIKEPETKIEYVNPKVLFFGDSITDYWDLDRYFDEHHINKGISGNVTDDLLNRIEQDVIDYQPKKIFILIGTNDLARGKDSEYIVKQIEKIVNKIEQESKNTEIYIESILPINDDEEEEKINIEAVGNRKNSDIQKANRLIKELCEKRNITYIDTYSEFTNEDGKLKLNYTKEGLHLSDEGYEVLANILKKYL